MSNECHVLICLIDLTLKTVMASISNDYHSDS